MTPNASVTANFQANPIAATSALRFVPATPCRLADTRNPNGPLGGPAISGGSIRSFTIPGACNIPSTALAYSLNLTVVPRATLGYVTMWPSSQSQPVVSTLNSLDGRVKSNAAVVPAGTGAVTANAAIVPAGTGGAINLFATNNTDMAIDINGYFAMPAIGGLSLYNLTPCRIEDTRQPAGTLAFTGTVTETATGVACGVPPEAQ